MPSWSALSFGVVLSGLVAVGGVRVLLRERRLAVIVAAGVAAALGPLLWDLLLRHTGGRFFTDAPGVVFPVSFEDTGSGVFATALAALLLGFGPLRTASGQRLALSASVCGLAALLVDVYLY